MITMTEDAFAQAMEQAAIGERIVAYRRDGKIGWDTSTRFPGQENVPRRRADLQERLAKLVAESPGQTAAELAPQVGKTRQSVGWSLRQLARRGEIRRIRDGNRITYGVAE